MKSSSARQIRRVQLRVVWEALGEGGTIYGEGVFADGTDALDSVEGDAAFLT
jgi:hypothetical protein